MKIVCKRNKFAKTVERYKRLFVKEMSITDSKIINISRIVLERN